MSKQKISITVDAVIFRKERKIPELLLIQRKNDPYKEFWALPGGFLEENENLDVGARRELQEETGLKIDRLQQIGAFGDTGRDPRGRIISIAFYGTVENDSDVKGADDAKDARWFDIKNLPALAFDHKQIIEAAIKLYKN